MKSHFDCHLIWLINTQVRADYCEDQSTKPSEDLLRLMEATLHHQWKDAFEQGKLSYVPTTLMMSGNLEGTIWKMILLRSRHVSCVKLTFTFMM